MSSASEPLNRRDYFRLRYPFRDRAQFSIGGQTFAVTELSERGMRFEHANQALQVGPISGQLHLRSGNVVEIAGNFHRREGKEAIVVQLSGVKLNDVFNEQRYLIRKYPMMG